MGNNYEFKHIFSSIDTVKFVIYIFSIFSKS